MPIVVKKFGGSSIANIERIEFVADKIFDFYKNSNKQIVVVVSAMQGETDLLQGLAYKISEDPDQREMAALLATGEQVTISLLAMALIKRGCLARSYTGIQLGIATTGLATKSKIQQINTQNICNDLAAGYIVIVAGFQGIDMQNGNITTLGRGGSDTTAVALAVALQAVGCEIYTDVDGVYTADPNLVPTAVRLNTISFAEMLELSWLGAKVMQINAVEIGSHYNLPIRVLSSLVKQEQTGTLICDNPQSWVEAGTSIDYPKVQKFAALRSQIQLQLTDITINLLDNILLQAAKNQLDLDLLQIIDTNDLNFSVAFVIANIDLPKIKTIFNALDLSESHIKYLSVAKLSMVGLGLSSDPFTLSKLYNCLISSNIVPKQIIATTTKVSLLIDEIHLTAAMSILHQKFSGVLQLDPVTLN